ncbi:hypothetical protein AAMO2058_000129700 [Amorphochlora amoebiformis]
MFSPTPSSISRNFNPRQCRFSHLIQIPHPLPYQFGLIFNSSGRVGVQYDDNALRSVTLKSKFERFQLGAKFWIFADAQQKFSRAGKIRNFQLSDVFISDKEVRERIE